METKNKTWPMLAHLSALITLLSPFLAFLGPLFVWLLKKNNDPETEQHCRIALNWQLSLLLASMLVVASGAGIVYYLQFKHKEPAALVEVSNPSIEAQNTISYKDTNTEKRNIMASYIGIAFTILYGLLALLNLLLILLNSVFAYRGEPLKYPPSIRFFKEKLPAAS